MIGDIDLTKMVFNWEDLDGRQFRVIVVEDSGVKSVTLYDDTSKDFFVVSIKQIEGETKC